MHKQLNKYLIIHTALFLVFWIGGNIVLRFLLPEFKVEGYSVIPFFFYFMGVALFLQFSRISISKPSNTANMYMRMRVIKVFISFAIIIVYWLLNKSGIRTFALVFVVFYLIYLILETSVFLRLEKYIRDKKSQNKLSDEMIN